MLSVDIEKDVASLELPNKQSMKAKYDKVFSNPSVEQIYEGIYPSLQSSFHSGENLAVMTQGFSHRGETVTIGNFNTPGTGLVQYFVRDLSKLSQPGDQIKFSYLNVFQEDLFDYLTGSEVRFGLIDYKRSFAGHKET